jgi:putative membrane protein
MLDLGLAVAHHVLVFGLTIMLAMELAMLRGEKIDVARLARLDAGYGLTAALVVAVGVARVIWGAKGWVAYQDNPAFWAKMAAFGVIGLISILPTLTFLRWSRAAKADPHFQPLPRERMGATLWVRIEVGLLILLAVLAATMARWPLS